jgi:hypothetical protein
MLILPDPLPNKILLNYTHKLVVKKGLTDSDYPVFSTFFDKPFGQVTGFKILPKLASDFPKFNFLPYITNKTIVTPFGVVSFVYQVINNNDADCTILNKSGIFEKVKSIKRKIISSKDDIIKGQFVLIFKSEI